MSRPQETITSKHNPLIKRVRALAHRDARMAEGMIVVEGLRAIIEAVRVGLAVETLLVASERLRSTLARQTVADVRQRGAQVVEVSAEVLDSCSERAASQGIIAIFARPQATLSVVAHTVNPLLVALFEPQDPGNIGTIARTADGAGATALVIFGQHSADPFDPKAIRASMGSLFSLPVIELGAAPEALTVLRQRALRLIGTAGGQGTVDLWAAPLRGDVAILLGNERTGLPPAVLQGCDAVASIPLLGHADSLNVAAAAAIFIYEAVRQRQQAVDLTDRR
jgi:TrmH family RNA methyltransferase